VPSDLDFLAEFLAVDRRDIEVLAGWLRDDGCEERQLPLVINKILNPNGERSTPEFWTGAEVSDSDERFTVRRQPPGWSRGE
jgi:hypothetical protein